MNNNILCFFDFETGSRNAWKAQPCQLSSVMINARKLEVIPGSVFNSLMKPELDDEKARSLGLDIIEDEALKVTRQTREQLSTAPETKVVWDKFVEYVKGYGIGWNAPLACGYNNVHYDNIIVNRLCGYQPYNFGNFDKQYNKTTVFHPIHTIDLMSIVWMIHENRQEVKSLSFDNMRKYFGLKDIGYKHNSLCDVLEGAHLLIKYLKWNRENVKKTRFEGAMAELDISEYFQQKS